ncbi:hypothetical protein F4781DRAFT_433549 [Annulohypoxylon bovei var. microspora]|nr:hypothetical protein F4781DRAFT_433549 [Annulohypoxylon bovei var. microspora]
MSNENDRRHDCAYQWEKLQVALLDYLDRQNHNPEDPDYYCPFHDPIYMTAVAATGYSPSLLYLLLIVGDADRDDDELVPIYVDLMVDNVIKWLETTE